MKFLVDEEKNTHYIKIFHTVVLSEDIAIFAIHIDIILSSHSSDAKVEKTEEQTADGETKEEEESKDEEDQQEDSFESAPSSPERGDAEDSSDATKETTITKAGGDVADGDGKEPVVNGATEASTTA